MSKTWSEISSAKNENRHEIILSGNEISQRIEKDGLDPFLFSLTSLNFLNLHDTCLESLPDDVAKLVNLQSLVLHSNKLTSISAKIGELSKLKMLDLSRNQLSEIPDSIAKCTQLVTLNISLNKLEKFPCVSENVKLSVLDLSNNKLQDFPDICNANLAHLAEVKLNGNSISVIPYEISVLPALKLLDLSSNQIAVVPGELSDIGKLKEINLKGNPVSDKRLLKLIDQCRSKQVLDYVRQNGPRKGNANDGKKGKKGAKQTQQRKTSESQKDQEEDQNVHKMIVMHTTDQDQIPNVKITESVKSVRPHILCCVIRNVHFDEVLFKKFIQMQTKLHDTVCDRRNAATIATHDLDKVIGKGGGNVGVAKEGVEGAAKEVGGDKPGKGVAKGVERVAQGVGGVNLNEKTTKGGDDEEGGANDARDLTYTARAPHHLHIQPLARHKLYTGAELFSQLQAEAESLRKEKKRNVYSGIHKYLYLLEGKPLYPCVVNSDNKVISFPPITNSDLTKISIDTKSILVEVTSASSQDTCRKVLDSVLKESLLLGIGNGGGAPSGGKYHSLHVQRVKIVDPEGTMKSVYPSRADLNYSESNLFSLKVIRE